MQKNAFHGNGTLRSRTILQEVRGGGYDIFPGLSSVVYNEDRSEDHSQKKKGSQYASG